MNHTMVRGLRQEPTEFRKAQFGLVKVGVLLKNLAFNIRIPSRVATGYLESLKSVCENSISILEGVFGLCQCLVLPLRHWSFFFMLLPSASSFTLTSTLITLTTPFSTTLGRSDLILSVTHLV